MVAQVLPSAADSTTLPTSQASQSIPVNTPFVEETIATEEIPTTAPGLSEELPYGTEVIEESTWQDKPAPVEDDWFSLDHGTDISVPSGDSGLLSDRANTSTDGDFSDAISEPEAQISVMADGDNTTRVTGRFRSSHGGISLSTLYVQGTHFVY